MKKDPALPPRVFPHGAWYRIAVAHGAKREWHQLSRIRDGLPALWRAFGAFTSHTASLYLFPALIADWQDEVASKHAPKTLADEIRMCERVAAAFAEFQPDEPSPPACVEFLNDWADKPRSFNAYRGLLRELFRFAIEKGRRPVGTNPVDGVIRTKTVKPRERCPSTSELRRVKVGCLYGQSGGLKSRATRTRSGLTMCAFIEVAYLTGQDVGRIVYLRDEAGDDPNEPFITDEGISFRRSKTGGRVLIEWTPRLQAAIVALRRIKAERKLKKRAEQRIETPYLFTKQDGHRLTYEAMSNAWQRGIKRADVAHFMARDIRARALTDKDARDGRQAANAMGTHTTEGQTTDYIRHKVARRTKATA
ncbi:MAG: integrase [Burkholderiaceae bacterium]|nr:integrase [Burkholderiaceae bacterium]